MQHYAAATGDMVKCFISYLCCLQKVLMHKLLDICDWIWKKGALRTKYDFLSLFNLP